MKALTLTELGLVQQRKIPHLASRQTVFCQKRKPDFIDYGFEPEFIGRLPVRVACEELTKEDLSEILSSSEGNVLEQYKNDFAGYEISLKIAECAIDKIAEKAALEKTGARGLVTVLEKTFRDLNLNCLPRSSEIFQLMHILWKIQRRILKNYSRKKRISLMIHYLKMLIVLQNNLKRIVDLL